MLRKLHETLAVIACLAFCAVPSAFALDAVTLTPRVIPVGKWAEGIVFDGSSLWVAESGQRTIAQLDLDRGNVTRRITVGRVNGRRFAFGAGIGLDAEAVRLVDEMGRTDEGKRPGDLAFAFAVLRALGGTWGHMEPKLEVREFGRAAFALIANGSPYTYAKRIPLPIAPEAQFELGLDLVAPVRVRRRSLVHTAASVLTGHVRNNGQVLYGHDLDRVEIVCDEPMPLHADGEDLGDVTEAVFEAERGAVSVLV